MAVVAVAVAVARALRRDWKTVEVSLQTHLLYQTWRVVAPVGQTYSAFMHLAGPMQKLVNQISQLQATRSVEQVRQTDLVSQLHPMALARQTERSTELVRPLASRKVHHLQAEN